MKLLLMSTCDLLEVFIIMNVYSISHLTLKEALILHVIVNLQFHRK